jgi:hypothetical protein
MQFVATDALPGFSKSGRTGNLSAGLSGAGVDELHCAVIVHRHQRVSGLSRGAAAAAQAPADRRQIQEDFAPSGTVTLAKLDEIISPSSMVAVLHVVGDATGAIAERRSVQAIKQLYPDFAARVPAVAPFLDAAEPTLSYTQWEAYLAIYHGKRLLIAAPSDNAPRERSLADDKQRASQRAHLQRLQELGHHCEITFDDTRALALDALKGMLNLFDPERAVAQRLVALDKMQINRLLALLDREDAIGRIVEEPKSAVQVVHGTHDCVVEALMQRLREVELPWLARGDGGRELGQLSQTEMARPRGARRRGRSVGHASDLLAVERRGHARA